MKKFYQSLGSEKMAKFRAFSQIETSFAVNPINNNNKSALNKGNNSRITQSHQADFKGLQNQEMRRLKRHLKQIKKDYEHFFIKHQLGINHRFVLPDNVLINGTSFDNFYRTLMKQVNESTFVRKQTNSDNF